MSNATHYTHNSPIGTFHIIYLSDRRWHIRINSEDLGNYHTAQHALDDLTGGHCDWPDTTDPATLNLPNEISDWSRLR